MADEWVTLTADDVYRAMSADEITAVANVQLPPGDFIADSQGQYVTNSQGQRFMLTPPVIALVDDVVEEVSLEIRGSIASGGYDLDDTPKIPKMLRGHAMAIVPFKLWSRIGGQMLDVDGARERLYDRANDVLRKIEAGEFNGLPEAGGTEPQGARMLFKSCDRIST